MALTANWNTVILACHMAIAPLAFAATPTRAQSLSEVAGQIKEMRRELAVQRSLIDSQAKRIAQQQQEIERLSNQAVAASNVSAASPTIAVAQAVRPPNSPGPLPPQPVGEPPALSRVEQQVEAVPQGMGVLTRAGHFVLEPSLEYTNSSSNRLVFRGIELIPGFQFGLIEASEANRNTLVATAAGRYGLTDRLEFDVSVPYLFRSDRIEAVQQREDTAAQKTSLNGHNLGDIEFGLRYQLNRPVGEQPIFVASIRVKTDTGKSPFSVPFDENAVATGLATGSGFWAIQPGLSFLLPSEPAVIFGGLSVLHQFPRNIDRTVGGVLIGRVEPGNAIGGNLGFGFALNPRFSFSLGYRHNAILPTRSEIGGTISRSSPLQVGAFTLGMSYRLTPRQSLDFGLEVGATKDAPDVSLVLRAPFSSR